MPSATYLEIYVTIDATAYTSHTQESIGLDSGVFKWQIGNSTAQSGFTAGILTEIGDISRSVDISETGGLFTDGAFDCSIKNTDNFQAVLESYGVKFIGLPVIVDVYKLAESPTISRLFTGFISAWSISETEINISANVDSVIPNRDLQETIVDLKTWPYAPEASVGLPYPVICGDVEYSPTVVVKKTGSPIIKNIPLEVYAEYSASTRVTVLNTLTNFVGSLTIGLGDRKNILFTSGNGFPSRSYRIVSITYVGHSPGDAVYITISGELATSDYSGHEWTSGSSDMRDVWFYDIVGLTNIIMSSEYDEIGHGTLSKADSVSQYSASASDYYRKYGATKQLPSLAGAYSVKGGLKASNGVSSLIFSMQQIKPSTHLDLNVSMVNDGIDIPANSGRPWGDAFTTLGYDYAEYTIPYLPPATRNINIDITLDISDLPDTDTDIYICFNAYSNTSDVFINGIQLRTNFFGIDRTLSEAIPAGTLPSFDSNKTIQTEFWTDGFVEDDVFELLVDDTDFGQLCKIPSHVIVALKNKAYNTIIETESGDDHPFMIRIIAHGRDTISTAFDFKIRGFCFSYNVGSDDPDQGQYISTEGETLGNDGTTHCNTIASAIGRLALDYAGIASINIDGTSMSNHVGRTLNEQITAADAISSICKQGFVAGYINKHGTPSFKTWLDSAESAPVYAFTSRYIIRDSIGGWNTTPLANCYNSFDIKHDLDYETGNYRYTMGIKAPQTAFPAITGAWDGLVYGIGTGSDAVAYPEASEAHRFVEAGYDETGIIKAMPPKMGELSWYVDPSWVGPPVVKTSLSAWKYLKNCAWWLSAPRKEVTFRVPLTFLGVELLDYCSFTDAIFTSGEVYFGWVTSLCITTEDIELTMSMERKSLSNTYTETGSADTTIDESGSRADTITEGA